jgi:hypothetical protein
MVLRSCELRNSQQPLRSRSAHRVLGSAHSLLSLPAAPSGRQPPVDVAREGLTGCRGCPLGLALEIVAERLASRTSPGDPSTSTPQAIRVRAFRRRKLDLSDSRITACVEIGASKSSGFGLAAERDLDAPQLTRDQGVDLTSRAHQDCPYSRATRGNIEVRLSVAEGPQTKAARLRNTCVR